jgi:formylglycine-generating enzyme required for sulfatase activity
MQIGLACLLASAEITALLVALTAAGLAGETFRDCDMCPEMVIVSPGSFLMGSPEEESDRSADESPRHKVTLARPFAMGKYEITHEEFDSFVKTTQRPMEPCFYEPGFLEPGIVQTGSHPALCMTWDDAKAYVEWLSAGTGKVYGLPTEAEWEYAARSVIEPGSNAAFSFGNDLRKICQYANSAETICDDGFPGTAPVGTFAPNEFGLYDMHGNVWEMAEDCLTGNYDGAPADGSKVSGGDCSKMVIRGGGWINRAGHLRSANRGWIGRELRDVLTGLRVVRRLSE